ncbi:MAG TPA: phospholipase D-like domain-containing protein [Candidatus Limnocylindrales bacterium]|jgi:cardiolipin synthase
MDRLVARGIGKPRSYAALAILLWAAAGCATVPDVDEDIAAATATSSPRSTILGADGPLTVAQSHRLLSTVANQGGGDTLLQSHLAIEAAVAGTPLTAGNDTALLRDGAGTFAAVFKAIRGARHSVNLEYYTLEDVAYDGQHLGDLLIAKRRAGVAVNIIYDSFGSSETPAAFFERLKAAGVKLLPYHPVDPLEATVEGYSPNDRDHRKIMIVDGRIGITGGVNLATYYQSKIPGGDEVGQQAKDNKQGNPFGTKLPTNWRDVSIRIEGPAVRELQRLFLGHWVREKGPKLDQADFFPVQSPQGNEMVRIIGSSPEQDVSRYYVTSVSAIRSAQQRVWLTTAYFVPTFEEKHALVDAAERGVDVRLMLPAVSDAEAAVAVAHSQYSDLMEAGVRIFELNDVVLHSKTLTIDGVWSAVGSSNFDHRSVLFNDEVDAVVLGRKTAAGLEEIFEDDQKSAKEIKLNEWRKRPFTDRMGDFFQRNWQYLL